jgi:hypothetical protein
VQVRQSAKVRCPSMVTIVRGPRTESQLSVSSPGPALLKPRSGSASKKSRGRFSDKMAASLYLQGDLRGAAHSLPAATFDFFGFWSGSP